jgi:hypothetical protein
MLRNCTVIFSGNGGKGCADLIASSACSSRISCPEVLTILASRRVPWLSNLKSVRV